MRGLEDFQTSQPKLSCPPLQAAERALIGLFRCLAERGSLRPGSPLEEGGEARTDGLRLPSVYNPDLRPSR